MAPSHTNGSRTGGNAVNGFAGIDLLLWREIFEVSISVNYDSAGHEHDQIILKECAI